MCSVNSNYWIWSSLPLIFFFFQFVLKSVRKSAWERVLHWIQTFLVYEVSSWLVSFKGKARRRKKVTFVEYLLRESLEAALFFNPWCHLVRQILSSYYRRIEGFSSHPELNRRRQCGDVNSVLSECRSSCFRPLYHSPCQFQGCYVWPDTSPWNAVGCSFHQLFFTSAPILAKRASPEAEGKMGAQKSGC